MSTDSSQALPRPVYSAQFSGGGQGVYRFEVLDQGGQVQLSVRHVYSIDRPWTAAMRNCRPCDIALAEENFKTLMWRCGVWYLEALLLHLNDKIHQAAQAAGQPPRLHYSLFAFEDSPFLDPDRHSAIAVVDRQEWRVNRRGELQPRNNQPWAAVFLHDGSLLSCLPEHEERYYPLRDVVDLVMPFCDGLYIDQADFLGRVHARYQPAVCDLDLSFLARWARATP